MEFTIPTIICLLLAYLFLVRSLRWRRYHAIHEKYRVQFETDTLTPEEAQEIIHVSAFYDMPSLVKYSLAFALFKAAAIPSISKLLGASKHSRTKTFTSKRYADTQILVSTWFGCPISGFHSPSSKDQPPRSMTDPRAMVALSRVNWLHSRYKISNDDYLYTLSIFVLEPANWAKLYGWRPFSPLECYASYVFWAEIGRRMGMQDVPESLEEMKAWSIAYEESHMLPAESNKNMAEFTMRGLHNVLPRFFGLGNFFGRLTICLLDERVRIAMMQETQPWYMHTIMRSILYAVAFVQRWLSLPRSNASCIVDISEPEMPADGSCPRLYPKDWVRNPWYKPQSSGFGYIRDRLAVFAGFYTEMPGPHLKSSGYRLEELGPISAEKQGNEKVLQMAAELLGGCPVIGTSYKPS